MTLLNSSCAALRQGGNTDTIRTEIIIMEYKRPDKCHLVVYLPNKLLCSETVKAPH